MPHRTPIFGLSFAAALACAGMSCGCATIKSPFRPELMARLRGGEAAAVVAVSPPAGIVNPEVGTNPIIPPNPDLQPAITNVLQPAVTLAAAPPGVGLAALPAAPHAAYKPPLAMEVPAPRGSAVAPPRPQVSQILFPDDPRPAVSPANFAANDCLPATPDWRAELDEKILQLQLRTTELETQLKSTQSSLQLVTAELDASRAEVTRLNQNLIVWQDRVRKMDADARLQQERDLQALDELSSALDQVLKRNQLAEGVRRR